MFTTTSWSSRIGPDTTVAAPLLEAIAGDGPTGLAAKLAGETPLLLHATRKATNGIRATRRIMTGMPFEMGTQCYCGRMLTLCLKKLPGSYCVLIALSRSRFGP